MKIDDLETGMVVKGSRHSTVLITGVRCDRKFFENKPNIKFLDANDAYMGQALREVSPDETFELIEGNERHEVLQIIIRQLIESSGSIEDCISIVQTALFGDKKKEKGKENE